MWKRKLKSGSPAIRWQVVAIATRRVVAAASLTPLVTLRNAERNVARWSASAQASRCAGVGVSSSAPAALSTPASSASAASSLAANAGASLAICASGSRKARISASAGPPSVAAPAPRSAAIRASERASARCSGAVASGAWQAARQACASAIRCVHRLPLSTVET